MERKFSFSEGGTFCETKRRGSLYIMHRAPRQNSSNFATFPKEGISCVLLFNNKNYFSFVAKRFLIVLTNSLETPRYEAI
jgi:hypothetical protein